MNDLLTVKSCLIVDDSCVIRRVMRQILENINLSCEEAEDGQQALAFCKIKLPDLVMLDWNMPVMNGIEFIRELRMLPNGNKPTVIFCTIENDMTHIQQALSASANEYIMKPFDADIITGKLTQLGVING